MAPEGKKARLYMLGDFMKGRQKVIEDPYEVSVARSRWSHSLQLLACRKTSTAFATASSASTLHARTSTFKSTRRDSADLEPRLLQPSLRLSRVDVMKMNKTRISLHKFAKTFRFCCSKHSAKNFYSLCVRGKGARASSRMTNRNKTKIRAFERFVDCSPRLLFRRLIGCGSASRRSDSLPSPDN